MHISILIGALVLNHGLHQLKNEQHNQQEQRYSTKNVAQHKNNEIPTWIRSYSGQFKNLPSGKVGPILEMAWAYWDYPSNINTYETNDIWIEFQPIDGKSIWIPSTLMTDIPSFRFAIVGDIDGIGYSVWNADRSILLGKQIFKYARQSPTISLTNSKDGYFSAHIDSLDTISITARWSADDENWSIGKQIQNDYKKETQSTHNNKTASVTEKINNRIHSFVLAENPHPWIEIDAFIGMRRIVKKFIYTGEYCVPVEKYSRRSPKILSPQEILIIDRKFQDKENAHIRSNQFKSTTANDTKH